MRTSILVTTLALGFALASVPSHPAHAQDYSESRIIRSFDIGKLRAALEAAGADSKGLKPALVERLVEVRRRASGRRRTPPTLSPVAFSETDEAEPPSPAKKRVWGLRRRFSPRKLRTRRPQPSQ